MNFLIYLSVSVRLEPTMVDYIRLLPAYDLSSVVHLHRANPTLKAIKTLGQCCA